MAMPFTYQLLADTGSTHLIESVAGSDVWTRIATFTGGTSGASTARRILFTLTPDPPSEPDRNLEVRAMAHALTKNGYGTTKYGRDAADVVHDFDAALDWLDGDAAKPWILPDGSGMKGE